uniref:Uncharacterized protein n=1 Tax=Sphaerodactylus townsendi TaxID=933632 RepID=A0ACB8GAZ7_9SAUR
MWSGSVRSSKSNIQFGKQAVAELAWSEYGHCIPARTQVSTELAMAIRVEGLPGERRSEDSYTSLFTEESAVYEVLTEEDEYENLRK